jgi:dGTPase
MEKKMNGLSELELRIINQFEEREEKILSNYATASKKGNRRHKERYPGIRPSFSRDADRILHSFAFTRYIDKTQVFYLSENDVITHRVIHVQLVSKIARLIARALSLNEDLVEAIALGHDIGHTPFGHEGEANLSSEITLKLANDKYHFHHSVQSVRFLNELESGDHILDGHRGLNLTLQVLDGILCHDGENLSQSLMPNKDKTWLDFDKEVELKKKNGRVDIAPMSLEGCLVRFVDVIAYMGRDVEDAVAIGLINKKDYPKDLGETNRDIVNNLAMDIIKNSLDKGEICYSNERFRQLQVLKEFNYERIYNNDLIKSQKDKIKEMFCTLYKKLLVHVREKMTDSPIFLDHIKLIDRGDPKCNYSRNTPAEIIVVDYMAGMTDDYFINVFNELFFPKKLPFNFRQIERATGLPKSRIMQLCKTEMTENGD